VGLMWSIAYRRIRLVNRKTAIVAKMTPHVGISCELIKPFVRRLGLSCDSQGCVTLWLRVMVCKKSPLDVKVFPVAFIVGINVSYPLVYCILGYPAFIANLHSHHFIRAGGDE
jgi:hypothetical protein